MEEKKCGRNKKGKFTKGNNFAKGRGSPGKYKAEYAQRLVDWFKESESYPTFEGFAIEIGVASRTLENWRSGSSAFNKAYERALDIQKSRLIVNGLEGKYNSNFAKFIASAQFGMTEKTEQKISGLEGVDINIEILSADGGGDK